MTLERRPNNFVDDKVQFDLDVCGALSDGGATTLYLGTMDGDYFIDKFEIVPVVSIAANASNYWVFTLQVGATVLGTWSTLTGQQGALTAGTPAAGVLTVPATGSKNDVLSVVVTPTGTPSPSTIAVQTRFVVHARQL
jgi:hypothetical protein